jgi:hypothetical protein
MSRRITTIGILVIGITVALPGTANAFWWWHIDPGWGFLNNPPPIQWARIAGGTVVWGSGPLPAFISGCTLTFKNGQGPNELTPVELEGAKTQLKRAGCEVVDLFEHRNDAQADAQLITALTRVKSEKSPVVLQFRPVPSSIGGQSDVPRFEIIPQFSFLSLNRPQSIISGHTDQTGIIIGHGDAQGIIGHTDQSGIIVGHADCGGIVTGHTDQTGIIVGHQDCAGIGVRFTYNATRNVALETVANFFPKLSPDSFAPGLIVVGHSDSGGIIVGHSDANGFQMQFGVKIGKRFGRYGIFGKAAPGLIRFSNVSRLVGTETVIINPALPPVTLGVVSSESQTYFTTDVGGVVEFYPSRRILIRFDLGDTIIRYGSRAALSPSNTIVQEHAETKHNFQFSAGIGFRF